jgi:hypothetical protein
MKYLPVINAQSGLALRKRPLVAVDLGFSGKRRTTGVAWALPSESDAKKHQFGEAVNAVAEKCRSLVEVTLILEAPLSAAFDDLGNPRPRGDFEREPQSRWWSVGPGAATALSALFFLRQLHCELKTAKVTIRLVEGFVSGDASGDHDTVAVALRDGFCGERKCQWHSVTDEGNVVSSLDWLECKSPKNPPIILQPLAA